MRFGTRAREGVGADCRGGRGDQPGPRGGGFLPSVIRASQEPETDGELSLAGLRTALALQLTTWQATTFLVGEYQNSEKEDNPIFTVADGILWLNQGVERNSIVRKLQVVKIRGQAPIPGLQTFRITAKGVQVFPRVPIPKEISAQDQIKK